MLVILADLLGDLFLILFAISLVYAICSYFASDETLYDRELLPTTDTRKLVYYIEPPPNPEPTVYKSLFEEPELYVTFVVPAYNEELRLPTMLNDTLRYLHERETADPFFTWEILIVDDGSKDHTCDVVLSYARNNPQIRLLRQPVNMGKGAAIQAGSLHARGRLILMVDADGATKIDEFGELEKKLQELQLINREAIVVGSRSHLDNTPSSKANRTFIRKFLGLAFHTLILISGVHGINDTQCGFRLFSREAARWLFPNQHIQRWCFDAELLVIGRKKGMGIAEIPVEWNEIEGSKMKVSAMFKMAWDLLRIAVYYRTGIWSIKMKADIPDLE